MGGGLACNIAGARTPPPPTAPPAPPPEAVDLVLGEDDEDGAGEVEDVSDDAVD